MLLSCLIACAARPPVTSDFDESYDFSLLKSYAWVPSPDKEKIKTLDSKRQHNAIETILNRKGYSKAAEYAKADFLLKTHLVTDKREDYERIYHSPFYSPFVHPLYGPWPHRVGVLREYKVGTLVLDIIVPHKKQVIWRGSISRALGIYRNRTPAERNSLALANAEHMLSDFPPKGSSVQLNSGK